MSNVFLYNSYDEFLDRDDKTINGVSQEYLDGHEIFFDIYVSSFRLNEGCWNCLGGVNCKNCEYCINCDSCTSCKSCMVCFDCAWCLDCKGCKGCWNCKRCLQCKMCHYLDNKSNKVKEGLESNSDINDFLKGVG